MGDFLPGTPSIIVSNMPGAGGLRAANHLFNVAPKDGTALGVVSSSLALEEALGTQGVQYRAADFTWIGRVSTVLEPLVTVDPAPAKQFSDTNRGQRL
jgi:tripartite-type tricarboxylate transporter receptor subunit TctC